MKKLSLMLTSALTALTLSAVPVLGGGTLAKRTAASTRAGVQIENPSAPTLQRAPRSGRVFHSRQLPQAGHAANTLRQAANLPFSPKRGAMAPAFAQALDANLYGLLTFAEDWGQYDYSGIYSVGVNSDALTRLYLTGVSGQGASTDGEYLYIPVQESFWGYLMGASWYVLDLATGETISVKEWDIESCPIVYAATYVSEFDYVLAFCQFTDRDGIFLTKITPSGEFEPIAETQADFGAGLTTAADGTVYGLAGQGALYRINASNGSYSKVGETGVTSYYTSAIAYDDNNKVIYAPTSNDGTCSLYSIDPETADAEKRYDFAVSNEFGCLYVPKQANPNAPATPTEVEAAFASGSLSGTVSFLPPTTFTDGGAASGTISYSVLFNGEQKASGTTSFGASKVTVPVTLTESGSYSIKVVCSNDAGESLPARISLFIGVDTPAGVDNVSLTRDGNSMKLTWDAPTGVHDGYLDASQVEYKVTRNVNGVETVVVPALKGVTSYTDTYAAPASGLESVYYSVEATYNGATTAPAASDRVVLGKAETPYADTFVESYTSAFYTVVDANADGSTWRFYEGIQAFQYNYSSENNANDYLVLPPMTLEAGKAYKLSFLAGVGSAFYSEKIAAYAGTSPDAQGLTAEIVPVTEFNVEYLFNDETGEKVGREFSGIFAPSATGTYYFAIKAASDADMWNISVTNIEVSAPMSATAPAAVTDLTLEADKLGAPKVTVKFTAPSLDIAGNSLSSLTQMDIYRDDEYVTTVRPAKGAPVSVVDDEAGEGLVTYTVIGYNENGEGASASASVYVGLSAPKDVTALNYSYGADFGEVVLSWPAVTEDINGLTLSDVAYIVCQPNAEGTAWEPIGDPMTGTSYTFRACDGNAEQDFGQYAVFAANEYGTSEVAATAMVPIGASYTMPFAQSAEADEDGYLSSIVGINNGDGNWGIASDTTVGGITSVDGDNGFFYFGSSYAGVSGRIFTGRIHIDADAASPAFSFYYYCQGEQDCNTVQPLVDTGNGLQPIGDPVVVGQGYFDEWCKVTVALDDYKGKDICVGIQVDIVTTKYTFIDRLAINDRVQYDLAAQLRVANQVAVGETLPVNVQVTNNGYAAREDYTVDFYIDYKHVGSVAGNAVAPGASTTVTYNYLAAPGSDDKICVKAVINDAADTELDNNTSEAIVKIIHPNVPAPTDLVAVATDNGAEFTWTAPNVNGAGFPTTEDFETCESFATMNTGNTNGWTFVDCDGQGAGGFQGIEIPNVPLNEPNSFFVLDNSSDAFNDTFVCHSGSKCLAALFNYEETTNDDWAISPELFGCAQTVTFFARAYLSQYPEDLEVLYSTTDTDPESFTSIKTFNQISTNTQYDFTEYSFDVPEGAKYFAFRYVSTGAFMLLIDDVTFIPADAEIAEFLGYNIYRDGVKLNDNLLTTTSYTETGIHTEAAYAVTAVYNVGESKRSNLAYPFGVTVKTLDSSLIVRGTTGAIVISGAAEPVTVADPAGRVIYRGESGNVPAAAGIYIVRIGNRSWKVLVK